MIYDDVEKGLRTAFAHIENARNAIRLRNDLKSAKDEFKTTYQEIFKLMKMLEKAKNMYSGLDKTYKTLLVLHNKTLFDTIKEIGVISETKLEAICQIIERIMVEEIENIKELKKAA